MCSGSLSASRRLSRAGSGSYPGLGNEVGGEILAAGSVLAGDDGGLGDAGLGGKRRLDLTRLDAEATDLHLLIGTAEIVELAVGAPAREIARAIHAAAGRPVRIGDETLGGEAGTAEIAPRQTRAGDIELARDADRHRLQPGIEHIDAAALDRPADRVPRSPRAARSWWRRPCFRSDHRR